MIVVLFVIAMMAVSAPIVAALIVSVASMREDRNWSLGEPARTPLQAIARRIVAFDQDSITWPRSKAQHQAEALRRMPLHEAVQPAETASGKAL